MEITRLEKICSRKGRIYIGGKECTTDITSGDRYFIENVYEELDSPGEWYLDGEKGELYYYPERAMTGSSKVVAPRLGRLFACRGENGSPVEFIRFCGLTFCETDYSPDDGCAKWGMGRNGTLCLEDAVNCEVENCSFVNIGKAAVCLLGGGNNRIEGNDVCGSAEGGMLIINSAGNTVTDNHIRECGQVYKHVGGVVIKEGGSSRNRVSHNLVHDISRYGISLKNPGRENIIEFNEVFNVNLETFDTGAIEVTQQDREFRSGSVIQNNLLHDSIGYSSIGGWEIFDSWGIYLDSYAGGYTVKDNITYRNTSGGVMLQGGRGNIVVNNIFIEDGYDGFIIVNYANNSEGVRFEKNIVCASGGKLFTMGDVNRKILKCDRNLYCSLNKGPLNIFWWGRWKRNDWSPSGMEIWLQEGFDKNSIFENPRFINAKNDDYRIRSDSPAFELGFKPIDIKKAGLLRKRCDCSRRSAYYEFVNCSKRCGLCSGPGEGKLPCDGKKSSPEKAGKRVPR